MPDNTFDVVSKIDLAEVSNAVQQALKEIHQRFDLKDSKSNITLEEKETQIVLTSADDYKLKAVNDILQSKLVKRGVPIKAFTYGVVEPASGSTVRQNVTMQQGIPIEKAKEIVKVIKDSKKKVQATIQGDSVRVSGKDRDALQETIALIRGRDFGIDCPRRGRSSPRWAAPPGRPRRWGRRISRGSNSARRTGFAHWQTARLVG